MNSANLSAHGGARFTRMHSPNLQPLLQGLLATLSDIDIAFKSDLETVRSSAADQAIKQTVIAKLRQHHRARRAPYVRQLIALQAQMRVVAA